MNRFPRRLRPGGRRPAMRKSLRQRHLCTTDRIRPHAARLRWVPPAVAARAAALARSSGVFEVISRKTLGDLGYGTVFALVIAAAANGNQ
jgi:hypothetical protein